MNKLYAAAPTTALQRFQFGRLHRRMLRWNSGSFDVCHVRAQATRVGET